MAVQAQFGGGLVLSHYAAEEQQMPALKDYGVDDGYAWQQYDYCAAQSELVACNGGSGAMATPSRKRRWEDEELLHHAPFLPLPGTLPHSATAPASTSGRAEIPLDHALAASELLWRLHGDAEVDALVQAECDRLRAALEQARKRQRRRALVCAAAVSSGLARRMRATEAQLEAARRRAAELEERVRLAIAEAQAWCDVAQGNEAVAAGLQATLDALLLRSSSVTEGFGESEPDDAQSCCGYVEEEAPDTAAAATASSSSTGNGKWACRACGEGEASVLVLPCRHLCLCKACERRTDACPVCAGAKNASLHIAPTN